MTNDTKYGVNAGFFDAINEDRQYSAEDMNRPYRKLISNGVFATPNGETSDELQVFTANEGMNIIVSAGNAFIQDKWFENPSDLIITISQNSEVLPRKDSIIAQVDKTQAGRIGNIVYRQGVASSNPAHPDINTEENIFEIRLADILVSPSCVKITQDLITDCRGSEECPWITSLIKQVDTSTLYAQWQAAYKKYYEDQEAEHDAFFEESKESMQNFCEAEEQAFQTWFQNVQAQLSDDVAGHLLNLINGMDVDLKAHIAQKVTKTDGAHGMRITSKCMIQAQDENGNWFDVANGALSNNELFKPYTVSNIKAVAGKNRIVISWNDPEDKKVTDQESGEVITAKWANTKVVMKTGSYPTNVQDGTLVVDNNERDKYKESGFEITGLNNNTTYYFRFFVYSDLDAVNTDENSKIEAMPTLIKPNGCTNISTKAGNGKITVSWTDPDNSEKDGEVCVWAGTKLVIKQGGYPTSPNDGTLVANSTVKNQYATTGYEITGLDNDVTYYGQLFPYSTDDVYNTDETNRFEATPKSVTVYGVQRQIANSATTWTRIEGGVGLEANATKTGGAVKNDFDNLYPWSDIITVDISANGVVNRRFGDPDFSFTNPIGYIMTYVPEFWYKRVQEDGYEKIYIADAEYEDFSHSEAFYGSRYTAGGSTSVLNSKSGQAPLGSVTPANFRTAAKNIGNNWGLFDIWRISAIQMLYLVEYADYNSQNTLGYGICSGSKTNSGQCDSLGMKSGTLNNDKAHAVIYRGFENIFANVFYFIDGININNRRAYINKNRNTYACDVFSGDYKMLGYINASSDGYVSKLGYDGNYSEVALPTEVSGSSSTHITDQYWQNTGNRVVWFGGYYNGALGCGLWCWYCVNASSYSYSYCCARLLFIEPV